MNTQSPRNRPPKNIVVRHFQPGLPAVTLEITRGGLRNPVRQICRTTYFIGRGRDCDLVISDSCFAEVHALLTVTTGGVAIRHVGNAPALLVNGRPVREVALTDQSVFSMGQFEFLMHVRPPIAAILDPSASLDSVSRMLETLVSAQHRDSSTGNDGQLSATQADLCAVDFEASVGIPEAVEPPVWRHRSRQNLPLKAA